VVARRVGAGLGFAVPPVVRDVPAARDDAERAGALALAARGRLFPPRRDAGGLGVFAILSRRLSGRG
jgi:hypothetical protein